MLKLVLGLKDRKLYCALHDFGLQIFNDHRIPKNGRYYEILEIASSNHVALIKTNLLVLTSAIGIFLLNPLYAYFHGERNHFVLVYLWGFNRETVKGYYINIVFQLLLTSMAGLGIVAMDVFIIALISIYSTANELIVYHCENFGKINKERTETIAYRTMYLRNIAIQVLDIDT